MQRFFRRFLVGGLLLAGAALSSAPLQAAVAMVTDLQGRAAQAGEGRPRELSILADLGAGAQVQLQAGAVMTVLYLDSGNEFVFRGPASIVFAQQLPEVTSGAKPEMRRPALGKGGRDIRIKTVGLVQGAMVMRSLRAGPRLQLVGPAGTVLEAAPEFRWQSVPGAAGYTFELLDDAGATVHRTQTGATSVKLPAQLKLREGAEYSWEVATQSADGARVSNIGKFRPASADLRAQAEALRPESAAPFSSRVIYAAWLDQNDLKDEARKVWQAVAAERPDEQRLRALAER
jgi:hypothetical protein